MNMKIILLSMLTLGSLAVSAQDVKREYEKPISTEELPRQMMRTLSPILEKAQKIRFYKEYDGQQTSYESKLVWQGRQLSIEFYEDGRLMDIEELISIRQVDEASRKGIRATLRQQFDRYRIERLQRQYSAEEEDDEEEEEESEEVLEDFMEGETDDLAIRYEMIAEVKGKDYFGPYELLFDRAGKLVNTRRVERRSADNVLY
jgi:hypothetical protein